MKTIAFHSWKDAGRLFLLPLLASLYPVLFLYAHNVEYLHLRQIVVPAAGAVLLAVAATALLKALLKHPRSASLSATGLVLLFWYYDVVYRTLNASGRLHHWHVIPIAFFLLGHGVALVHRFRDHPLLVRFARACPP